MSLFSRVTTDRVTLVKKDGRRFPDLPASVQSGKIFTFDPKIPIEDDDEFHRALPSGILERFVILDAGFFAAVGGMPASYQSKVRKSTAPAPAAQQNVYNLTGANSRVNIQSSDSSTNVVNVESHQLFADIRQAIQQSSMDAELVQRLTERVEAMQASSDAPTFAKRYSEFIADAANHMTLLAPFLPALSQLLNTVR
jgi:FlaG/FlaF family flagellin (archaellin)